MKELEIKQEKAQMNYELKKDGHEPTPEKVIKIIPESLGHIANAIVSIFSRKSTK